MPLANMIVHPVNAAPQRCKESLHAVGCNSQLVLMANVVMSHVVDLIVLTAHQGTLMGGRATGHDVSICRNNLAARHGQVA